METKNIAAQEPMIGEGVGFERIRRITGYLVGTLDRFNNGARRSTTVNAQCSSCCSNKSGAHRLMEGKIPLQVQSKSIGRPNSLTHAVCRAVRMAGLPQSADARL